MRIEAIERSKHKQERVLVHLEGGDLLRITEAELLRFGLFEGLDIDGALVVELQAAARRSEAKGKAAALVGARPLSRRELTRRLCEKGAAAEDASAAADWLEEIGALDDGAYAGMLVRHYSAMGYGEGRLRAELQRRGVPRERWDEALALAPPAQTTIEKVILGRTKGRAVEEKERKKLSDLLLRRGFAWRDVKAALEKLGGAIGEEDG